MNTWEQTHIGNGFEGFSMTMARKDRVCGKVWGGVKMGDVV
jgi:hypothetical protein